MKNKGFTLVELLAVIAIIAIIAIITIPIIINLITDSKENTFKSSVNELVNLVEQNYTEFGRSGSVAYTFANNKLTCSGCPDIKFNGTIKNGTGTLTNNNGVVTGGITNGDFTYVVSGNNKVGDNLLTNGFGEKNSVANFSNLTWDATNKNFYTTTSTSTSVASGEYIPIDETKTYFQSATVKANNTTARYYIGFAEYDENKNFIDSYHVGYVSGSKTTLAKDIKAGDTVVYLTSAAGFNTTLTSIYNMGFIFWNYKNNKGTLYPEETYSRNVFRNIYTMANVNKTANTVTLTKAWTGSTIPAGTKLSQSGAFGGTYNYGIASNSTLSSNYMTYTNEISGYYKNTGNMYKQFRYGTKYVRFMLLNNYNNTQNSTIYLKD